MRDKTKKRENPSKNANWLSWMTFWYMFPIFRQINKNELTENDYFEPLPSHKSEKLTDKIEKIFAEKKVKRSKNALLWTFIQVFRLEFFILSIFKLLEEWLIVWLLPFAIGKVVTYFEETNLTVSYEEVWFYGTVIVIYLFTLAMYSHPSQLIMMTSAMKLRLACSSLVYRKALRLDRNAMSKTTVGQMVNLLSNDVRKFDEGFVMAPYVIVSPMQALLGVFLLYNEVGVSALVGMSFLWIFVPLQIYIGSKISKIRLNTALKSDERVRLLSEFVSGIQVIKMYCWEIPFSYLIKDSRRKEMISIKLRSILMGIYFSIRTYIARTAIFLTFLIYVYQGNSLTADKVYVAAGIYNVVKPIITSIFAASLTGVAEVNISLRRIEEFLRYPELKTSTRQENITPKIILKNINSKWLSDSSDDLKNINLNINSPKLTAIIGPVGSGKSSLLSTLLGELEITKGIFEVEGDFSYAAQEPWLFQATVRDNILFGESFDSKRYEQVIEACSLTTDLKMLSNGDQTLIGDKGRTLSGGQKARIGLARAVYRKADIYLLDDPLSAVDSHVGKHIYQECIEKFLSGKICILVTHQLHYIKSADHIVIMKDGMIENQGTYKDFKDSDLDFAKLMLKASESKHETTAESPKHVESIVDEYEEAEEEKESQGEGRIRFSTYTSYMRFGGNCLSIFMLFFSVAFGQFIAYTGDYFLSYWVNYQESLFTNRSLNDSILSAESEKMIITYAGINIGTIIFSLFYCVYFMLFFIKVSINFHNKTFSNLVRATMNFFNTNPMGRILNRFSRDFGAVDEYLPIVMFDIVYVFTMLCGLFFLTIMVEPYLLIAIILLIITCFTFWRFYVKTSRCVKRLESVARSYIFNHMTTSVNGMMTIRAFKAQKMLTQEFDHLQDRHTSSWFLFIAANRCFAMWIDFFTYTFIATCVYTLIGFSSGVKSGNVGLIITQFIDLLENFQFSMRQWTEMENQMVSVERIMEYTDIKCEEIRKTGTLPVDWPSNGEIEFQDLELRYLPDQPPTLKKVNFNIKPKEKIGVVGRTGAGKSSLITALFQLYQLDGKILIDQIDSTKVPLEDVRKKISIIPQEPIMFSGTLRKNLDPFEEHDDDTLWKALGLVELKSTVSEMPGGLQSLVSEGGNNFSLGQKQLLCLARALIRKNKILVMDEATASVDPYTDDIIQKTIREQFAHCSVLTIAHRLHTVMDSDKILVMDGGKVVEFDAPSNLLKNSDGFFAKLVKAAGEVTTN